jgi:hypothetical protein
MMADQQTAKLYAPDAIHLIRTTQQMNLQLSSMADQKASILMGATFVIFTISLNQASRGNLDPALIVLGASAFVAAMFAILAVIPAVAPRTGARPNLLFFGSFTDLAEEEYIERLVEGLGEEDEIIRRMARDIYQNGAVLRFKKYRYLRLAYLTFLIGLVATVVVFVGQRVSI